MSARKMRIDRPLLLAVLTAALVAACSDGDRAVDGQSSALTAPDPGPVTTAWPSANIYLRTGDTYPRSSSAVFYAPEAAADGSFTLRFGISPNDRGPDGQIVAGSLEATATIASSEPKVAHYEEGTCRLTLRADNAGDGNPLEASIAVEQSGDCPAFGGADASGVYRVTIVGD
jgi:hypothetical protein